MSLPLHVKTDVHNAKRIVEQDTIFENDKGGGFVVKTITIYGKKDQELFKVEIFTGEPLDIEHAEKRISPF